MEIFLLYANIGLAISIIELIFLKNEQGKETFEKMRFFLNTGGAKAIFYLTIVVFPVVVLSAPINLILRIIKMPAKLIKKLEERRGKNECYRR